jgi:predicted transcriptional regulator
MRTTIDLPDDLNAALQSMARDRDCSMSTTVVDLLRRSLSMQGQLNIDRITGFPLLASGRPITTEDVRHLDD